MGYRTNYSLAINCESDEKFNEIVEALRNYNEDAKYAFDCNGNTEQSCTWYDHEEDLIEFSKKHPNLIFTLYGTGDEPYDIWKKYFKNSQMQHAPASIAFDECAL